jgi:ubiquinone/menaquinone biosynthesis C-methylase UbiE
MRRARLLLKLCAIAATSRSTRLFYDRISPFYELMFTDHLTDIATMTDAATEMFPTRDDIRVLDIACGTGVLSRRLRERGFRVTGIDFSFQSLCCLHEAEKNIRLVQADAGYLPLRPSSFDLVTCMGAWRHFHEPELVVSEIRRVLRPTGVFVVGYFPPKLGGLVSAPSGSAGRAVAFSYASLMRVLNYDDRVDQRLESQTLEMISRLFTRNRLISSGRNRYLILAELPRQEVSSKSANY